MISWIPWGSRAPNGRETPHTKQSAESASFQLWWRRRWLCPERTRSRHGRSSAIVTLLLSSETNATSRSGSARRSIVHDTLGLSSLLIVVGLHRGPNWMHCIANAPRSLYARLSTIRSKRRKAHSTYRTALAWHSIFFVKPLSIPVSFLVPTFQRRHRIRHVA